MEAQAGPTWGVPAPEEGSTPRGTRGQEGGQKYEEPRHRGLYAAGRASALREGIWQRVLGHFTCTGRISPATVLRKEGEGRTRVRDKVQG